MKKVVFSLIVLGVAAFAALTFLFSGKPVPTADSYIQGIDISHHQGAIDWPLVASGETAFVFMKATEGGDFVDPKFKTNWRRAGQTGMQRGAYHFFTQCRTAEQQAANFIRTVGPLNGALPPVLDLEHMGPCREGPTLSRVDLEVVKLMDILEAEYGSRPILYTTREFHDAYLVDLPNTDRFWIRSIFTPPKVREKHWLFWQHHHRGSIPGIKGPVDLNAFRGSAEDLEQLLIRPQESGAAPDHN